jgi:hypothetical protein
MTTTETTLTIVCPSWCTIDAQEHASDLWNSGGDCIHQAPVISVADVGRGPGIGSLDEPKPGRPVEIYWTSQTAPQGRESAAPMFWIDDREYSVEQALALRDAIMQAVETYRAAGGVA